MDAYRKQVTSSPEAAQSFLVRLGVLTKGGKANLRYAPAAALAAVVAPDREAMQQELGVQAEHTA